MLLGLAGALTCALAYGVATVLQSVGSRRLAVADGLVSLAVAGALAAAAPPARRAAVLAGMAGAALPDADKPAKLWFGCSPFPRKFDRFHNRIQREAWRRGYVEVLAAGALAPAALIALRGSRVPA